METTELFLLFPKYKESSQDQSLYINGIDLMDTEELHDYIQRISAMNAFFVHEEYQGYYDALNIAAFAYPLEEIEDCYPGEKTYLRTLLKEWENWRDQSLQDEHDLFTFYARPISNDTLCEIAKRKKEQLDSAFLLINHQAFLYSQPEIKISCSGREQEIHIRRIEIKEIAEWFIQNRKPQRIYNWNRKHGELGVGAHPDHHGEVVSKLLCSRVEAKELLKKAIGLRPQGVMYCYDDKYAHYMEFKMESANTFHSFHIEDESRVPKVVKDKINYLNE